MMLSTTFWRHVVAVDELNSHITRAVTGFWLVVLNAQDCVVDENAVGKDLNAVLELAAKSR